MNDAITTAIVELAKLAVMAYTVKATRDVVIHGLNVIPRTPTKEQIIDAGRQHGLELVMEGSAQ